MRSSSIIILAGLIAITGKWVRKKNVDTSMVIGGIVLALIISVISEVDEDLAEKFAYLILFAVLGTNAEELFSAVGLITGKHSGVVNPPANTSPTTTQTGG